ncbi:MAG: thiol:disulfide interchange protein DsbA/DsbL [Betaproteobacteria bacterium]|nr:thiol:disulfide interchange protein DsbA/DsbL [Betaproteobacteria bacterium]MCC6249570.1 thiol:disulfide interchange protein DsbA/DsbL [Rubrivivax sp.]MCL4696060.1 thiol:disulfide interchange protein DsbA/DsbL [Burkholderiaceae bacterium]
MSTRRDFSRQFVAAGAALAAPQLLLAQAAGGAPVEGQHYVKLSTPAAVSLPSPDKKVDVVEFFWYGCPHCNTFEPLLESWIKRLPPDVSFRRVHVGFGAQHQIHQKLHYALEELGLLPTMHKKVFAAMHAPTQRRQLISDSDITAFGNESGIDGAKLVATMKSFGVNTKAAKARQLTDAYKIDGVPALGVQGRWFTSGSLAGSLERMVIVADHLITRARG